MNGVCVMFKGYIDVQRLDGAGYLEYDEDNSKVQIFEISQKYIIYLQNYIYKYFQSFIMIKCVKCPIQCYWLELVLSIYIENYKTDGKIAVVIYYIYI